MATLPSYIDTASCLCALEASRGSLDNSNQLWRCIGNVTADVTLGNSGKWYRTLQEESSLAGLTSRPQNWAGYPPDLSTAYILLQDGEGNLGYQALGPSNQNVLQGKDVNCNGKNDTKASGLFYQGGPSAVSASTAGSQSSGASSSRSPTTWMDLKRGLILLPLLVFPLAAGHLL